MARPKQQELTEAEKHGADVHPEHYELLDAKTNEQIPWSAVVLEE